MKKILKVELLIRRAYWWICGYVVCYAAMPGGYGYCKRRSHHLGMHCTGSGREWDK